VRGGGNDGGDDPYAHACNASYGRERERRERERRERDTDV